MRLIAPAFATAFCLLATHADTAELGPAPRIDWRHDGLRQSFDAAAEDGKPLVIVAEGDDGRYFSEVLRCPRFDSLADSAHFVLIKLPVDEDSEAGRLLDALHMDPAFASTVVVLRTSARPFVELARLRGYHDETVLLGKLAEAGLAPSGEILAAGLADEPGRACVK